MLERLHLASCSPWLPRRVQILSARRSPAERAPIAGSCQASGGRVGRVSISSTGSAPARRLRHALALAALLLACLLAPFAAGAQTTVKSIEGKVLSAQAAPLAGSIVYLQDLKTNIVKTLIAPTDGAYHFGQLPADTDYNIWAEYKGKKSKVRLVSSFDSKRDVTCDFHISDK